MNIKHRTFRIFVWVAVIFLVFASCEDDTEVYGAETKISRYSSNESHNPGQNCMSCHTKGGRGEGWFTVAGTVYDSLLGSPFPGATVKLYTEPAGRGELMQLIEVDRKGNYYTTEQIENINNLYALVEASEVVKQMRMPISSGNCNGCHGESASPIFVR